MEQMEIDDSRKEKDNTGDLSLQYFWLVMLTINLFNAKKWINKHVNK